MKEKDLHFQIKFSCYSYGVVSRISSQKMRDYSDYFTGFNGIISAEDGKTIGRVEGVVFRVNLADKDGISMSRFCDSEDEDASHLVVELFNDLNRLTKDVLKVVPECSESLFKNILFIDRLYVFKKFRKSGVARVVVQKTIDHYGASCSLAVVQPHPLRYENEIARANREFKERVSPIKGVTKPSESEKAAVRKFWGKLGFRDLKADYMVLPLVVE